MSMMCAGAANRMLRIGHQALPPARTLPSAPTSASTDSASASEVGRGVGERRRLHPGILSRAAGR